MIEDLNIRYDSSTNINILYYILRLNIFEERWKKI